MSGNVSDSDDDVAMAMCGACDAEIPADSTSCPECEISFTGVKQVDKGECGACQTIISLDSKSCPNCNAQFVLDDLINRVSEWMKEEGISVTDLFGEWDENDDGVLTGLEIRNGLRNARLASLPRSDIERFLHQIDINQDQLISLEELSAALSVDLIFSDSSEEEEEESASETEGDDETEDASDEAVEEDESESEDDSDPEERPEDDEPSDDSDAEEVDDDEDDADAEEVDDDEDDADAEEADDDDDDADTEEADDDEEDSEADEADDADSDEEQSEEDEESLVDRLLTLISSSDETLKSLFSDADEDFDGKVSIEELKTIVEDNFGDEFSDEEVEELLEAVDTDGDGKIDLIEMVDAFENPDEVEQRIKDKGSDKPNSFEVFMMRNEENIFPILWSMLGLFAAGIVINVYGFFATLFKCDEGNNAWLLAQEWCANNTKLNLLDFFSSSDPSSWSPTGRWGIPDILAIIILLAAIGGSILYWRHIKAMKETFRKKKDGSEDEESDSDDESTSDEDSDEEDDDESDDSEDEEESDDDDDESDDGDESDEDSEDEDEDSDEEAEIDVGSHVGVDHDDEEWFGTIVKFDEDDDEVLVKDDESGEEYWVPFDALFVD